MTITIIIFSVFQERQNTLMKNLADNETAAQLTNLEKKLSHFEQNNFAIAEFVANKKAEKSLSSGFD